MRKKIFYSIWIVAMAVMVLCMAVILFALYDHFTDEHFEQLRNETDLVRQGLTRSGISYFDDLRTKDVRITWITADGRILYDNEAETASMVNHLEREEVRDALLYGHGESLRWSSTLSAQQLYNAVRMDDGTILRLSVTQVSIREIFGRFLIPAAFMCLVIFLISLLIASRLAVRITKPLNTLDLDSPLPLQEEQSDPEIRPLLRKLNDQQIQLHKDRETLEQTSRIRQEFTANVSHELKTPLHVISGYAELIENGMTRPEDIPVFAGKIRSEAQRMSSLTEDIIELSALDEGAPDRRREEADLYRIAQNAAESLRPEADESNVTITVEGTPAVICGIPDILFSIVYNLCDNAVKYSRPGGTIRVTVKDQPDSAVLSVADNGIGIPAGELDRIFERFYRVDKSRSKAVGGTGLGLSIVKHGARIHNADIQADSSPGKGSVFTLTFRKSG